MLIPGDGIGPEVIGATTELLEFMGAKVEFIHAEAGYGAYKKYGTPLPKETVDLFAEAKCALFGAVTTPPSIEGYRSPIIQLRQMFDLYANVRPFKSFELFKDYSFDFVIIRENTEGLYVAREHWKSDGIAIAERQITQEACGRIATFAFEMAKSQSRNRVTAVHKANVLRVTDGLFLSCFHNVAKDYPMIRVEEMLVDSTATRLIVFPESFDIILAPNLYGDILSDLAAGLVGSLGFSPSANLGVEHALFEPIHGSAPDIAGNDVANPYGTLFASCMLLEHLGEKKLANRLFSLLTNGIANGILTHDLGGRFRTSEVTKQLIKLEDIGYRSG